MAGQDGISAYHPLAAFCCFALVLTGTMVLLHPLCLLASFAGAFSCCICLRGWAAVRRQCRFLVPMALGAALLNPMFSHQGATILAYLPSGNPLTLESMLYGLAAGCLLASAVLWCDCCSAVMTADKCVFLFGKLTPALSLVLSMTLRAVPRLRDRFRSALEAERSCAGTEGDELRERFRRGGAVVSGMISWTMESAIGTADSMRSRGYGLPGRTAFSLYHWTPRDRGMLLWLGFCALALTAGQLSGGLDWQYYPICMGGAATVYSGFLHLVHLALCLTPTACSVHISHTYQMRRQQG